MALTATATRSVKREIIESLEMSGCVEVTASPNRPNIFYAVEQRNTIEEDFVDVISSLKKDAIQAPRILVYC